MGGGYEEDLCGWGIGIGGGWGGGRREGRGECVIFWMLFDFMSEL